jgi:hypothetical protein
MGGWQQNGAFVIQFRPQTDIEAGRFEGRVEHIASYKATRFSSLDELHRFIALLSGFLFITETLPDIYYKFMTYLVCEDYPPGVMKDDFEIAKGDFKGYVKKLSN